MIEKSACSGVVLFFGVILAYYAGSLELCGLLMVRDDTLPFLQFFIFCAAYSQSVNAGQWNTFILPAAATCSYFHVWTNEFCETPKSPVQSNVFFGMFRGGYMNGRLFCVVGRAVISVPSGRPVSWKPVLNILLAKLFVRSMQLEISTFCNYYISSARCYYWWNHCDSLGALAELWMVNSIGMFRSCKPLKHVFTVKLCSLTCTLHNMLCM